MPVNPCIETLLNSYPELHKYLEGKAGVFEKSKRESWIKAAKELQHETLDNLHNIYNKIGVKGFEAVAGKVEVPETFPTKEELKNADQIVSTDDAESRLSNGERIFGWHEMDEQPYELTSVEEVRKHTPDLMVAIPRKTDPFAKPPSVEGSGEKGATLTQDEEARLKELHKKNFLKQEMTPSEQNEFINLKNKRVESQRKAQLGNQLEDVTNVNGELRRYDPESGMNKTGKAYQGENWEATISGKSNTLKISKRNPETGEWQVIHESNHPTEADAIKEYEKHNQGIEEEINSKFDSKLEQPTDIKQTQGSGEKNHSENIKDKFREEFSAKGVSDEHITGALALMDARAKSWASEGKGRTPEQWYNKIADVKKGEFETSDVQFQGGKLKAAIVGAATMLHPAEVREGKIIEKNKAVIEDTGEHDPVSIKVKDDRKIDATSNKPVTDRNNLSEDSVDVPTLQEIVWYANKNGIDPYTALAIAYQETHLSSDFADNPMRIRFDQQEDTTKSPVQQGVEFLKEKFDLANRLGKKTEAEQIQAYNGYGKLAKQGEEDGKISAYYGVDVSKEPIDTRKNPVYGKRVIDIRDNILKKNPELVKLVEAEKKNIAYQEEGGIKHGALETLQDGRVVIHALDAPDVSTMVHEIFHVFEKDLTDTENKQVKDFGGSEAFARAGERYLRTGIAPKPELQPLFKKFREWLKNIYQSLVGSPIEKRISPEIKNIFDRLLTEKQTPVAPKRKPETIVKQPSKAAEARKVYKDVGEIGEPSDARGLALRYLAGGNKVNESSVNEIAGTVKRAALNTGAKEKKTTEVKARDYSAKDAPTIDEIAHSIWDELPEDLKSNISDQDIKNQLNDVVNSHNTRLSAAIEFRDRYIEKTFTDEIGEKKAAEIEAGYVQKLQKLVDELPENQQKELIEVLREYQDQYGNVDWERLEKDSDGFDTKILSLTPETQKSLDGLIEKNIEPRQGEPDVTGSQNVKEEEGQEIPTEKRLKSAQSAYTKAVNDLSSAEDKISQKQSTQSGLFEAPQKEMFGVDRDEAKSILDPLRQKVKEAKTELESAQKEFDRSKEQHPALFNESLVGKKINAVFAGGKITGEVTEDLGDKVRVTGNDGTKYTIRKSSILKEGETPSEHLDSDVGKTEKVYEEIMGSRPSKTDRIPVDPIISGGEPKKISDILFDVSKATGATIRYNKPSRSRAAGTYSPGSKVIKIRFAGDLDTTAHELGHDIDDHFGVLSDIVKNPNKAIESELKPFSKHGSKPQKGHPDPRKYKLGEGFAEWLRAFIVNPKEAIKAAPEMNKLYEDKVSPEYKAGVKQFSDDIRKWAASSGRDMTLSNIEWKPEDKPGIINEIFKNSNNDDMFEVVWSDKVAANFINPLQAFDKSVQYAAGLRGLDELLPKNDPTILARLLLSVDRKFGEFLEHGLRDANDKLITDKNGEAKTFNWLLEPLDNSDEATIKKEMEDTLAYMVSERTVELSKRFGRESIITGSGGGVYTDLDVATKTMNEFNSGDPKRLERIKEGAERYRSYANDILDYMVDKGRLDIKNVELIKDNNIQYVALQRVMEAAPNEEIELFSIKHSANRLGSKSEPIHRIKGSTRTIRNPYVSLLDATYKGIKEADRNNVLRQYRDLLTQGRSMYEGSPIKLGEIGYIAKAGETNTIPIFIDGKLENWKFNADIYKGLRGLDTDGFKVWGVFTLHARVLRNFITKFPVFAARNWVRDLQDRLIKSDSGVKDLFGDKEHWRDVARNGGLNAGYYMRGHDHYYGLMEEAIKDLSKDKKTIFADPSKIKHLWHGYENFLQKSETANRVAEYRGNFNKAKAKGMDDYNASLYAAFRSRDLMDFALMGHYMKIINQIIPFSNAAVQGLRSSIVRAAENPAAFLGRMALYTILPQVALWVWNHRDEEAAKEYEAKAGYERDMFWNLKIGKNKWLMIPKPYELGILAAGIDRGLSKLFGYNDKAFSGYAGSVAQTTLPFDLGSLSAPAQPIVEAWANKSFYTGKHIIPTRENALDLTLRHTENATRLGQALQKISGLDARKIDYMVRQQFGYTGNLALGIADIGKSNSRFKIGLQDLGFFKQSPAYNSKPVQDMVEYAEKWNLKQSSEYRYFNQIAGRYFDAQADSEKDDYAKQMVETANKIMDRWSKMKQKK